MKARTLEMTSGKPAGLLLRFALPLMVGNLFQQLYTVVDTAVVGKALGVDALAALGACDWLNWMMLGIIQGLTQGFAVLMAQSFGARTYDQLRKVLANSILLSVISAVVLLILGQLLIRPVLRLLGTPAAILDNSVLYLRYMFAGIPVIMAFNLLASLLRSMGDSNTPLYAMIVAAITNIILDLVFVLVFHWGIDGAAIATLIAQVVSCVYCFLRILKMEILRLHKDDFKIDLPLSGKLLVMGFPMAMQNAIIALGGMILQTVVNAYGVIFIAGYTATNKIFGLLEMAAISYGYAVVTYTGQNLGAGQYKRIRQGIRSASVIAFITSAIISTAMLLFGKHILSLFLSGDPNDVAQALDIGYEYLFYASVFLSTLYLLHVVRSTVQGMGNSLLPMISGIVEFFMRTGCALLLPAFLGHVGIFLGEVMAWIGADVVLITSYLVLIKKVDK